MDLPNFTRAYYSTRRIQRLQTNTCAHPWKPLLSTDGVALSMDVGYPRMARNIPAHTDEILQNPPWFPNKIPPWSTKPGHNLCKFWTVYSMGRARLLDNLSSKRGRLRVYCTAPLLDSSSSKWDRVPSLDKRVKGLIVRASLISLAPSYLKKRKPTFKIKWSLLAILVNIFVVSCKAYLFFWVVQLKYFHQWAESRFEQFAYWSSNISLPRSLIHI